MNIDVSVRANAHTNREINSAELKKSRKHTGIYVVRSIWPTFIGREIICITFGKK